MNWSMNPIFVVTTNIKAYLRTTLLLNILCEDRAIMRKGMDAAKNLLVQSCAKEWMLPKISLDQVNDC